MFILKWLVLLLALIAAGLALTQPSTAAVTTLATPSPTAYSVIVYASNGQWSQMYADTYGTYQLYLTGQGSYDRTPLTDREGDAFEPDWSPDCQSIVYSRDHAFIEIISAEGGETERLTQGGSDHSPVWLPDGSAILYASEADQTIYRMKPDGTEVQPILTGVNASSLEISPDGTQLLFTALTDGRRRVYLVAIDGSDIRPLLPENMSNWDAAWSPDGEQIAYATSTGIYLTTPDGQSSTPVTITGFFTFALEDGYGASGLQWSPDGTRLAMTISSGRLAVAVSTPVPHDRVGPQLAVIDLATGELGVITYGFFNADPDWKPCAS